MTPKVFIGLALATLVATVAAVVVVLQQPSAAPVRYVDEPAFPELRADPDAVAKVTLATPEGSFSLVRASADRWVTPERADYPVAASQVRDLIVTLADMRLIEAKTSRAERYARLEVEDPDTTDAKSRLIRLEDADGKVLAEAIVGKQRQRLTGSQSAGTYLRRPGDAQSWLASGGLRLEPAVTGWLEAEIVDLEGDAIRQIEVRPATGPAYAVVRESEAGELRLDGLAEGEAIKEDADFGRLANALSGVRLEDVKPREQIEWPAEDSAAALTTFDGLELTVRLAKIGEEHWAMFDASQIEPVPTNETGAGEAGEAGQSSETSGDTADTPAANAGSPDDDPADQAASDEDAKEPVSAEALNERLGAWAYRIPQHLFNRLTTAREEWLAKKDETS